MPTICICRQDEADKMLEHEREVLEIYKTTHRDARFPINAETIHPAVVKIARVVMQSSRP